MNGFQVGDWVRDTQSGKTGIVKACGWFHGWLEIRPHNGGDTFHAPAARLERDFASWSEAFS